MVDCKSVVELLYFTMVCGCKGVNWAGQPGPNSAWPVSQWPGHDLSMVNGPGTAWSMLGCVRAGLGS